MFLICGLYPVPGGRELFLMFKFARLWPAASETGRYHFEQSVTSQPARYIAESSNDRL